MSYNTNTNFKKGQSKGELIGVVLPDETLECIERIYKKLGGDHRQYLRAVLSGKTEQVCTIDKTDCLGYKGGKYIEESE